MNIFNSLGSNYDLGYILRTFFAKSEDDDNSKLVKLLEEKYEGKVILTYKGREALRLALRSINKADDYTVGICGFTCFAVYEAIAKEGYRVEYLDIEKDSLNFSFETLKSAFKNNPKLKIVFVQNTLGYPCDIERISKFCKENDIVLVEDLAHSIGTTYPSTKEAGTVGDFIMLSFSQDKVIDKVSGGGLVVRSTKYTNELRLQAGLIEVSPVQKIKDKLYPVFSVLIRNCYSFGLGKLLHFVLKKLNILPNPMIYENMDNIHSLPTDSALEIYSQFQLLKKNILHRQKISEIYKTLIHKDVLSKTICEVIDVSTNLRFPIFVDNRKNLTSFLKKSKIFVSDVWYDVPIGPKKYFNRTSYKSGMCPNAEIISARILNLPTHRNVSENDAEFIANKINIWLKSQ